MSLETWTEESLQTFGRNIQKLILKQDLSRSESYEMFRQVLLNKQPYIQQGAFLAALTSKKETPQEIAGAWQAIYELDTNQVHRNFDPPLLENSGTGMDQLKTFNVSSAASLVAAAGGARIARHGARALTSFCGTVDLMEALGIDVECDVQCVERSIDAIGIGLFNGMSAKVHPHSLARILSQIRFGSTLNIAASLASPCRPTHGVRGVYSEEAITDVTQVMKEIGYLKAMVVHGFDSDQKKGMDELSTLGVSKICEFENNSVDKYYSLSPEDVGITRARYGDIAPTKNIMEEALRFVKVIAGVDCEPCQDITCLNAGAILYIIGQAKSIKEGIEQSRMIIEQGLALEKLCQWLMAQCDPDRKGLLRFLDLAAQAGVKEKISWLM